MRCKGLEEVHQCSRTALVDGLLVLEICFCRLLVPAASSECLAKYLCFISLFPSFGHWEVTLS